MEGIPNEIGSKEPVSISRSVDDIRELQESINKIYIDTFKNYSGSLNLSVPHIPRVSASYLDNRAIILGQETNTWYRETEDDLKNVFLENIGDVSKICLNDRYDKFISEAAKTYPGKFWEFTRLLYKYKILNGDLELQEQLPHCWMNLFVVEACTQDDKSKGRPTKNWSLATKIMEMQGDLLFKVFQVLKPKLIVCLTGYSLDKFLFENALNVTESERVVNAIDSFVLNDHMLAEIIVTNNAHLLFNTKIIRCYHPTYFLGYINVNKKLREKISALGQQRSNSKYYEAKVIEKLREYAMK